MPDDKEMYLKLFRASEEAVNLMIAAQRGCEELYINAPEPELKIISLPVESEEEWELFSCRCVIIIP